MDPCKNIARCDFDTWHHTKRAFEEMKIDWQALGRNGTSLCFFVLHANGPAVRTTKVKRDGSNGNVEVLPLPKDQTYNADGKVYKVGHQMIQGHCVKV